MRTISDLPSLTVPSTSLRMYGVVVTTVPSLPGSITLVSPTFFVGSATYLTSLDSFSVTTLGLVPTLMTSMTGDSSVVTDGFPVTSPVLGFKV